MKQAVLLSRYPDWVKGMLFSFLTCGVNFLVPAVVAQTMENSALEEVIVFGRNNALLGVAQTASEGTVSGADLLVRPMLRIAEMLEVVPGLVAVQHSGSGKANQYFLRGFNLDHGTDFLTHIDGIPWNLRSHGHGQGYLDVNGLIPQMIESIDFRKGPYRADVGDFGMVATSFINTINELDSNHLSLEVGENGWRKFEGGQSMELGEGILTTISEIKTYSGPWERDEELRQFSVWGKYFKPTDFGSISFSLFGYDGNWHPTEQIPERVIGSAVCRDKFCSIDPSAGGDTSRWVANIQMKGADWHASAYLQYYDWLMQSNPTYDFQINQFDKRATTGAMYGRTLIEESHLNLDAGVEFRHDNIGPVGVDRHTSGQFLSAIGNNDIKESSLGAYTELIWLPNEKIRVLAGLRADYFNFKVVANNAGSSSGKKSDSLLSPKIGLAYAASDALELYANRGRGYHSNDARGVVNSITPLPGLAEGTGYEIGARLEYGPVKMTAAYWWLDLASELLFVGDSNSVEARGPTTRKGSEITLFWRPLDWLGIDAVYASTDARWKMNPDGLFVEGALETAGQIGFSALGDNWEASFRLRHQGPYALTPDNTHRASGHFTGNLRFSYKLGDWAMYAELFNILDEDSHDIIYYYEAHVEGFDPPGLTSENIDCNITNCRMSRATEPRTLRIGLKWEL